eukprot:TRINITY_DN29036_c0_g1_i2.p1 TRINITY_DN29036_c0_g1~~TRINITY_DN29036_c0_g1_i2.p1  ORF type:complete len:365 (-),score=98.67 TRINITY_DN29036_c0_g1_i2:65-1159(-)
MDLCAPPMRYVMQHLFQTLTQSLAGQHALGFLYDAADRGTNKAKLQRFMEDACMNDLVAKLADFDPDEIVCTHFLPTQLMCSMRKLSVTVGERFGLAEVITDLDLQYMWVLPEIDMYFLPREDAQLVLQSYKSTTDSLSTVSGIPIMPEFAKAATMPRADAMSEFGLDPSDQRPVVLVMSGGKLLAEVYQEVLAVKTPLRIVVVMGRQADVREQLRAIEVPPQHKAELLGFVKKMPELLRCGDLLVGKSGGLTIAEAAVHSIPMVVLDPIPGQEQRNADVMLELGAALKVNDLALLRHRLEDILKNDAAQCKYMAQQMAKLAKPSSAFTIADALLERQTRSSARAHKRLSEDAQDPESKKQKTL